MCLCGYFCYKIKVIFLVGLKIVQSCNLQSCVFQKKNLYKLNKNLFLNALLCYRNDFELKHNVIIH